jgi:hypothetical protein
MMQTGAPRRPQPLLVNEIIVPLPIGKCPAHIYVKAGTNVFAFTKYNPLALKKVSCEPALGLSNSEPYASLAKMDRWTLRRLLRDVSNFLKRDN